MIWHIIVYVCAALLAALGLAGTVVPSLPGLPLLFLGMLIAAWADGFAHIGPFILVVLGLLTALAVFLDFWAGVLGAKRAGASKKAVAGSTLGAFIGLFFGLWGIFLGPFIGAVAGELHHQRQLGRAAKVGLGTWIGLIAGIALQLGLACTMLILFITAWFV